MQNLVEWAKEQAEMLLGPLGNRWLHVQGVTTKAHSVSKAFDERDATYLITAAYLHDICYAPPLKKTGFHPIDGACYLQSCGQVRLASLVAHHSETQFEAHLRGLLAELDVLPRQCSYLSDALTYCDITTSPTGQATTFQERIVDTFRRYGEAVIILDPYIQTTKGTSVRYNKEYEKTVYSEL